MVFHWIFSKKLLQHFFLYALIATFFSLNAQVSTNNPFVGESQNFYEIQKKFNDEYAKGGYDLRGFKQYKRWEYFMEPRVYPTGNLPDPMATFHALDFGETIRRDYSRTSGNWTSVGPAISSGTGIGRVNFVAFHPTDSNIIFVGAPAGGIWKSVNGGSLWTTNTDHLPAIGFSDMVINPDNPDIIYAASGDGDANDTYSLGVLKSTDGGETWQITGLNWNVTNTRTIRKLIMHPDNPDIIFAATTNGIYRTTNAAVNWTRVRTGGFKDIKFKPGNPSVIYATSYSGASSAGARFYHSTDGGTNWTEVEGGFSGKSNRMAIGVTPADTNYVYLVASESPTSNNNNRHGFLGLYRSKDGGASFETMSTSPNILGWATNGSDLRGQGWFDLDIAVSPANHEIIFVGGVNIWKSENEGKNWTLSAHWYGGGGAPWVHADIHHLVFDPRNPNTLYVGCDGGIFRSFNNGRTYTDISQTLVITQLYKLGISAIDPKLALVGSQDNGTKRFSTTWHNVLGGDGMECIIDPTDDQIMYGSIYYGDIRRSVNGGNSFTQIKRNIGEQGGWVTPYVLNPKDPKIIFAGYVNIWKNYNRGYNDWVKISNFSGATFVDVRVAPSDTQVIYAATRNIIYRTRDGGDNWDNISSGLPTSSASITAIAVREDNADVLWVTFSGYSAANKIFVSADGGNTWANFTGNLPNLPANTVVHQKSTDNGIYVGMDVGVYYRDSTLTEWVPFFEGLPNVVVRELEIYYHSDPARSRIKAATYGRGLWESEFYVPPNTPPRAVFASTDTNICVGYTIQFQNNSAFSNSFKWYFEGGEPATSTDRYPRVRYDMPGTYNVTLVANNNFGSDSLIQANYIIVDPLTTCVYIMPSDLANDTYTTCSGKLFDPGGESNYTSNLNVYVTIAPPDASGIVLEFLWFDTERDYDFLDIFDGPNMSSPLIGSYSGNALPEGGLIVSSGTTITLRFRSDALDNRKGFELNWRCLKPADPPFAYFKKSTDVSCTGIMSFVNKSLNNPETYLWRFGDGSTSTLKNPVHQYKQNGIYTVWLVVSNTNGSDSISIKNVIIDMPPPPELHHANLCGIGSMILRAEGEGNIWWYANKTDSLPFAQGTEYQTPQLTSSKTYYVKRLTPGNLQVGGPFSNTIGTGHYSSGTQGLIFDAHRKLRINSVKIYASGTKSRNFQIKDLDGNIVYDSNFNVSSGESRIPLNAVLEAGMGYTLLGIEADLYRNNSGISFPYKASDLLTITSSTMGSNFYFYFYDWEINEMDACISPFVPINAMIFDNPPAATFTYNDSGLYYQFANQSTNIFKSTWFFGDGNTSTENNPHYRYEDGGNYTVKLIVENACGIDSFTRTIAVTNSISEPVKNYVLTVFPNPNTGSFRVRYRGSEIYRLRIVNLSGQIIDDRQFDHLPNTLDLDILLRESSGLYYLQLITKEQVLSEKIFIR